MGTHKPVGICPHCRRPVKALPLTWRMLEALQGLLAGKNCKEIAYDLGRGIKTAEALRAKLYEATGTDNLVDLVHWALENGFDFED